MDRGHQVHRVHVLSRVSGRPQPARDGIFTARERLPIDGLIPGMMECRQAPLRTHRKTGSQSVMSETAATNSPLRRIELPGTSEPAFTAATPQQIARLQYLGIDAAEPLSGSDASQLIDQTNQDPAFAERIEAWEAEKQALHPDLFRVPPRFASGSLFVPSAPVETVDDAPAQAGPSVYAPISSPAGAGFLPAGRPPVALQPARSSPVKFLAAAAVLTMLGAAGWYVKKSPWVLQTLHAPAIVGVPLLPDNHPAAAVAAQPSVKVQPTPNALPPEEFAARVAESQRQAVARYPALGTTTSEINMRFVHRYKLLLSEHSARLQDPNWPLQLADDCAAASGIKVAGTKAGPPAPSSRTR